MVIDAKMFNEKERTIIPYTTNIIREAYGIDISHLIFNTDKKINIFKQLNVDDNKIFEMFEDFYNKYAEDSIVLFLLNKENKAHEVIKDFYNTFFAPDNLNKYEISEYDKIITSFTLFCLCKLDGKKKYTKNLYTKKDIIDYYCKFWYNLFNHITILNQLDILQNDINFILEPHQFIVEVNNMFGIKYNSFILKPNVFNFIHMNIENMRNKIEESMRAQYNLMPNQYTINLRTFIEEPSGIIDKIVFHNLNQTEKNEKTLNIIWNEGKLKELENDLRSGRKYFIEDKSYIKKYSLKKVFKELYSDGSKNNKMPHNRYTVFNDVLDQYHCGANHCCEGYKEAIFDNTIYNIRTPKCDNNQIFNRIYLEFDNNFEKLSHIYYQIEFDVSFDIYKNLTQDGDKYKFSGPRVNQKLEKQILPDFIAGKIHFRCLVDFSDYDNRSFLFDFFSFKLRKDELNIKTYKEVMSEELTKNFESLKSEHVNDKFSN